MGCDIHLILEKKIGANWVGVSLFNGFHTRNYPHTVYPIAVDRSYARFSALAGVRGDGPPPRGVPDDISVLAKSIVDEYGNDGHSHSWLPLVDATKIFMATNFRPGFEPDELPWCEWPTNYFFNVDDTEANHHRLVFFFDN